MGQRMDLNGDGTLSDAETAALRQVWLVSADSDGDGMVTEDELLNRAMQRVEARLKSRIAKRFARMDTNGDGRIDSSEFDQKLAERFARRDAEGEHMRWRGGYREDRHGDMRHHRHGGAYEDNSDGAAAQ
jgi:hypothetical protein